MNILVVDDNRDLAETMADILEMNGYSTDVAFSGEEAVHKYNQKKYDLSFIDVKLPGMNGVESFLEIKKNVPDCKAVMMTGYRVEHLLEEAIANGAIAVMKKPFDTREILSMIDKVRPEGIILVADDDENFADSMKDILEDEGYAVYVAKDGQEAVDSVQSYDCDLLILDLRMPIMNGLEVYLELKKLNKVLPTIIMTGFAAEEADVLERFKSMNVSGIIHKPFDPKDLLADIKSILTN